MWEGGDPQGGGGGQGGGAQDTLWAKSLGTAPLLHWSRVASCSSSTFQNAAPPFVSPLLSAVASLERNSKSSEKFTVPPPPSAEAQDVLSSRKAAD